MRELQVLKLSLFRRLLRCLFGSSFLFGLLLCRRFAAFKWICHFHLPFC